MYGAESLIKTLLKGGVNTCFMNPGTSEMHFVSAADTIVGTKCILTLFEGVATGAADGYARVLGKPASVLLHCGPGLANGLANLHNARRAQSPIINIVGDQANNHVAFDPPLTADTYSWALGVSTWVKVCQKAEEVGAITAQAIYEAGKYPGGVATIILPSDASWGKGAKVGELLKPSGAIKVEPLAHEKALKALRSGEKTLILLGGKALCAESLSYAYSLAQFCGADLMSETFCAKLHRGNGSYPINAVAYVPKFAVEALAQYKHLILVEAKEPIAFFAYPNFHGSFVAAETNLIELARKEQDGKLALEHLLEDLKAPLKKYALSKQAEFKINNEKLVLKDLGLAVAALLPENSIIVDESVTSKLPVFEATKLANPHQYLQLTGGAIGSGMPMAIGAAVAAPHSKIINLQADGSALYTVQSLWTQARENLNITTVIFSNRKYKVLLGELKAMNLEYGQTALNMMNLGNPDIDWVSVAKGFGVNASKATTNGQFYELFKAANEQKGPFLIEAIID